MLKLWPLEPRATSVGVSVVMTVLWSFLLVTIVEISTVIVVGVPVGLTHDAFVFWLVIQLVEILPSTLNQFLYLVVHDQWLNFLELLDWLAVFSFQDLVW